MFRFGIKSLLFATALIACYLVMLRQAGKGHMVAFYVALGALVGLLMYKGVSDTIRAHKQRMRDGVTRGKRSD